jgi:hypothetical protein
MEDRDRCRACGEERAAGLPGGSCPDCLLRAGLVGDAPAGGDLDRHEVPDHEPGERWTRM